MSIPAEYLLPQDMVLLRDLETGVVATTHATDANEALANGGDRYELVLPNHLPRASRSTNDASLRPLPSDTAYLAADLRKQREAGVPASEPESRPLDESIEGDDI